MTYMLDTCIIIDYLKGNKKVKKNAQKARLGGNKISIDGICYYEIMHGLMDANSTEQSARFDILFRGLELIFLDDQSIFDRAAEIYSDLKLKGNMIKEKDILIASTADFRNSILVTSDPHFDRIQGIRTENWLT